MTTWHLFKNIFQTYKIMFAENIIFAMWPVKILAWQALAEKKKVDSRGNGWGSMA